MAIGAQSLVLFDELWRLIMLEVTGSASPIADNRVASIDDMSIDGMALRARGIRHALESVDVAGLALRAHRRMRAVDGPGEPPAIVGQWARAHNAAGAVEQRERG